jgi:hypothetical protein
VAETGADTVLTCAAIGRHIDHVRTRDAVLTSARTADVEVRLWQDQPYAALYPGIPDLPPGHELRDGDAEVVSAASWDAKLAAVAHYGSQLESLRHDGTVVAEQLDAQGRLVAEAHGPHARAELTWRVHPTPVAVR